MTRSTKQPLDRPDVDPVPPRSDDHPGERNLPGFLPAGMRRRIGADGSAPEAPARRRALRLLRDPVVAVFVLAGIFDLLSGDFVVHGLVLFAVAGALVWDAIRAKRVNVSSAAETPVAQPVGPTRSETPASMVARRRPSPVPAALAGLVFAGVVGGFAQYSWPASIAVLIPGAAAVAIAWRGPIGIRHEGPRVEQAGAMAWTAVFLTLAVWELAALLLQPSLTISSYAHPTISVLMDTVLASHVGRSMFLAVWMTVGWVLLEA